MTNTRQSNKQHLTHPKYRADIDGLRAIAILSVVGFHAFPQWIKGGFVGVDIFFVISGFLISSIIFGNLEGNSFNYVDFYSRRIKRIFPALILVLTTSYAFGWFLFLPDEFKQLGKHIAAGAGFISNFILWHEVGYFDNSSDTKPLLHLWSLGIEEQFYILWPLLLGLVWKFKLNFLKITLLIAVASFSVNIFTANANPVADFYSPLSRFWELMTGGVLAYLTLHKPQHLPKSSNKQSIIGLILICIALLSINSERAFPGWWATLPTLGAFLVISAQPTAWVNRYLLSNRVLVSIGLISYPLYLWHWAILAFLRINDSGLPSVEDRIAAVLVSFILAWLTYWLIEKPVRFNFSGHLPIIILCVLLTLVGFIGFNTFQRDGLGFRLMQINPDLMGAKPDKVKDWRLDQCFLNVESNKFADSCLEDKKPMIFLWGDSHAAALYPGLKKWQDEYQFGIAQYTSAACKPLVGKLFTEQKYCKKINDDNLALIEKKQPEFVFLHANWNDAKDLPSLSVTISSLQNAGVKNIVLIGPDPLWRDELPRMAFAYYRKEHKKLPLRMKENNAEAAHDLDLVMKNFAHSKGIHYVSSLDILCNQDGCLTRTSANSLDLTAMDADHLTPQAASYEVQLILLDLFKQNKTK